MSYAESASSAMRALEFLVAKHCPNLDKPAAPKVDRQVLASIPRVATPRAKVRVEMTEALHDDIYAVSTTTFLSVIDVAKRFNVSESAVRKIMSRRHRLYHPRRSEEFRYKHLAA